MGSLGLARIFRMHDLVVTRPVQMGLWTRLSVSSTLGPNRRPRSILGLFIRGKKHCLPGDIRVWSFETGAPGSTRGNNSEVTSSVLAKPACSATADGSRSLDLKIGLWKGKDFVL
jgi:hypothetical protein